MDAKKCDKCGAYFDVRKPGKYGAVDVGIAGKHMDICQGCQEKIALEFMEYEVADREVAKERSNIAKKIYEEQDVAWGDAIRMAADQMRKGTKAVGRPRDDEKLSFFAKEIERWHREGYSSRQIVAFIKEKGCVVSHGAIRNYLKRTYPGINLKKGSF